MVDIPLPNGGYKPTNITGGKPPCNWLVVYLPLWKIMEFASWDYEIPNIWKVIKTDPNHQSVVQFLAKFRQHLPRALLVKCLRNTIFITHEKSWNFTPSQVLPACRSKVGCSVFSKASKASSSSWPFPGREGARCPWRQMSEPGGYPQKDHPVLIDDQYDQWWP